MRIKIRKDYFRVIELLGNRFLPLTGLVKKKEKFKFSKITLVVVTLMPSPTRRMINGYICLNEGAISNDRNWVKRGQS